MVIHSVTKSGKYFFKYEYRVPNENYFYYNASMRMSYDFYIQLFYWCPFYLCAELLFLLESSFTHSTINEERMRDLNRDASHILRNRI